MNMKYEDMQPWQRRVVDELTELDIKERKLQAFQSSTGYDCLSEDNRKLLRMQYFAMSAYKEILEMRIIRFE